MDKLQELGLNFGTPNSADRIVSMGQNAQIVILVPDQEQEMRMCWS